MSGNMTANLATFEQFLIEKGWRIVSQREIDHGRQVNVTDGTIKLPVNFYSTGKIVPGVKPSEMKNAITEWANLLQAGLGVGASQGSVDQHPNRVAKFLVVPDRVEAIRDVVLQLPGDVMAKEPSGPAEIYRIEIRKGGQRLTITQYSSGTLMIQGLSSVLFDEICELLDAHLAQSFSARAARYIPGEVERAAATPYLESPDAENEAARWLFSQIKKEVLEFMHPNDQQTLLAAAGVRNAVQRAGQSLPDYSVVVMPFAKSFEGFVIRLAEHLELVGREILEQRASSIEIGGWLETVKARLPDPKRYAEISDALTDAWGCRHKAVHSDFAHPLSVLKRFNDAELEIGTIFRAMSRAHRIFVEEGLKLLPPPSASGGTAKPSRVADPEYRFENVDRDALLTQLVSDELPVKLQPKGRKNVWEVIDKQALTVIAPRNQDGLVVVKGQKAEEFTDAYAPFLTPREAAAQTKVAESWIGVDESGKGDIFGPLVIAGVVVTPDKELALAKRGVRDSKILSDSLIFELAEIIRRLCPTETLVLLPPEYNAAYEQHGRNLNRLLAWGHARVISSLNRRTAAKRALSDQFGDEARLKDALSAEGCKVELEQRPRAESDMAVAAASIMARAEFVAAINDYTAKAKVKIPLGASAEQVKAVARVIYRKWGRRGLERITKMHFKTVAEIIAER